MRQHRRPSVPRRNRLTPRPSGRLRRRLTQALGSTYVPNNANFMHHAAGEWLCFRSVKYTAEGGPSNCIAGLGRSVH